MKRIKAFIFSMLLLSVSVLGAIAPAFALGPNLVTNPSAEAGTGTTAATGWASNKWGTNTVAFTRTATGHTGSYSLTTKMTARTSGDAKWYFNPITVTPGTSYTFSNWYQSNVASSVDVEVTSTTGAKSYLWMGAPAISAAWKQNTYTFTAPANAASVTVFHSIGKVGQLTVDDYSLATTNGTSTPPTAPSVSLTAPAAGATVSDTSTLSATASDAQGIKNVQFKVDGINVGAADTTSPYSLAWDSKTVANGAHIITAIATNTSDLTATSTNTNITVNNVAPPVPTPPTVSVTAPAASATIAGTTSLTANAGDAVAVKDVQFKIDGVNVGAADTTAPYSFSWDSKSVINGSHTVTAVATNTNNLSTTSSAVSFTVNNPVAPTVSVTAPTAGATLANTANLTADASGSTPIASVQFKVDGTNVGAADTTAPYAYDWDTKSVANGTHSITATATNTAGQSTTSTPVSVTVTNTVTPPTPPPAGVNLIPNPSFENTANGTAPDSWQAIQWGTNTSSFTYLGTGHTGNRSTQITTTSYSNGAANWYYDGVAVTAGKTYQFSDWYKSNVDTEVDAEVTMSDGSVQYFWLGNVSASTDWAQFKTTFTAPAGAKNVTIYHILAKAGTLTTDDYSISEYTPAAFNRGIVSVTFDDGWANQYQNANPLLKQLGMLATYYLISGELNTSNYMTNSQVLSLHNEGNEIASHSVSHPDFTTLTATQQTNQFKNSQTALQTLIGAPVTNFAYPLGAYNSGTITRGKVYYASQRSVDRGANSRDNLDVTKLKIQEVNAETTNAQVQTWISEAVAQKTWLILCYHEIANTAVEPDDVFYTVKPADFSTQMNYLKSSGASVQTVKSALSEVLAQQ